MARSFLFWMVLMIAVGCAEKRKPFSLVVTSDDVETGETGGLETDATTDPNTEVVDSETAGDSESTEPMQTDVATDTGDDTSDSDSDNDSVSEVEPIPGEIGDPCWIPPFSSTHPNAGLPDCAADLHCIGDSDEAWCTQICTATGSVSDSPEISGWCCGEVGSACSPTLYFMPPSMSVNCAPRILALGVVCQASGDLRCAPLCNGTEIIQNAVCVQVAGGGFCSYDCAENGDCVDQPAFSDGCCGAAMGNNYCMTETSDKCMSFR